jgi:stage II sporulation protein D
MAGRWMVLLAAACGLTAAEVSIGVFRLFQPPMLVMRSASRSMTVTQPLTVTGDWTVEVPGRISRQFQGKIAVTRKDGALVTTVTMDIEAAVAAVVAAEMPTGAPVEALKAAAVLARSFYASSPARHPEYDFCDTTHCQFLRETPHHSQPASLAAAATAGIVLSYRDEPFGALYSASCGGSTLRALDVGLSAEPYPYFPVKCERCLREEPAWRKTLPLQHADSLLRGKSEAARLQVVRLLGWSALPGNNYNLSQEGNNIVFTGRGQGHGVGVCQRGAIGMAAAGATFRDILRHYLPDTTLQDEPAGRASPAAGRVK